MRCCACSMVATDMSLVRRFTRCRTGGVARLSGRWREPGGVHDEGPRSMEWCYDGLDGFIEEKRDPPAGRRGRRSAAMGVGGGARAGCRDRQSARFRVRSSSPQRNEDGSKEDAGADGGGGGWGCGRGGGSAGTQRGSSVPYPFRCPGPGTAGAGKERGVDGGRRRV
jgi:hypothetical protein